MPESRIKAKFEALAKKGEGALICYVVAGYPDIRTSERVIDSLVAGGADMIEIGIPFSDPIADGRTIQAACNYALGKGTRPEDAMRVARNVRKKYPDLPLLFMTYSNILLRTGFEKFMARSKDSGIDGFIIPDMPAEEAQPYIAAASELDLATVFLASPNTSPERLSNIIQSTAGFLYLVSVFGITGARDSFEDYTRDAVKRAKTAANHKIPVAVGFGISTPAHARYMMAAGADAVIVGSAILDKIGTAGGKTDMLRKIEKFAKSMKRACTRN
ncbi:MAG TPA: tryptophan synthase subunit alpha [Nitrososphaera sp.]|jgi:tryptophan synthase alpha chain